MREIDYFNYFKDKVFLYLKKVVSDRDLRIWSVGCFIGEELYMFVMIIDEFFSKEKMWWDFKILVIDIFSRVFDLVIKGIYGNEDIDLFLFSWKVNYFKKYDNENSIIIDKIRNEIIYRKFNFMDEIFLFKCKFYVIFCRNVMIYFDFKIKVKFINKFYDMIECGGYLFIGYLELFNREEIKYKYIMFVVYRKE